MVEEECKSVVNKHVVQVVARRESLFLSGRFFLIASIMCHALRCADVTRDGVAAGVDLVLSYDTYGSAARQDTAKEVKSCRLW